MDSLVSNAMWLIKSRLFLVICLLPFCRLENIKKDILFSLKNSSYLVPMAEAILHFKAEFYIKNTNSLSVVVRTSDERHLHYFNDILTSILTAEPMLKMQVQVDSVNKQEPKPYDYFNILMIDSYEAMADIHPGWHANSMDFSEYYMIVLHGIPNQESLMSELKKIFEYCWQYYIINVVVLVEVSPNDIELYTYFPFSPNHCKSVAPKQINRTRSISEMTATTLFPDKSRNLHGCPLVVALFNVPPYIILPEKNQSELVFGGTEGQLLHLLASAINFTVDYVIPQNNERRGLMLENGTLTGAIKLLKERTADFSMGSFRRTRQRSTILSSSSSFYQTKQVLTVLAKRENWSTYETIMYPFNFYVWCSFALFYILPIILAYILHQVHRRVYRFIYGVSGINSMIYNWTSILLQQTALSLPTTTFARYILMTWILLTLILRSSYQGLLFDFFNSQKDISPPSSLAQLIQNKYQLVVSGATADTLSEIRATEGGLDLLVINKDDSSLFAVLEENPHKLYATSTPHDFLSYYIIKRRKYGVFHVLKDEMFLQHNCIYFTKHSYLLLPINNKLFELDGSGILKYWWDDFAPNRLQLRKDTSHQGKPLTMGQMYGIFVIQFGMWIIAFMLFLVERFWK